MHSRKFVPRPAATCNRPLEKSSAKALKQGFKQGLQCEHKRPHNSCCLVPERRPRLQKSGMEGRGLRPRRSVDYTAKESTTATPGWLKLNPLSPTSPALAHAKQEAMSGKENVAVHAGRKGGSLPDVLEDVKPDPKPRKRKAASHPSADAKPPPQQKAQPPAGAGKGAKARSKKDAQLATRGRNAGLQVLPAEAQHAGRASEPAALPQAKPAARSRKSAPARAAAKRAAGAADASPQPSAKKARVSQPAGGAADAAAGAQPVPGLPGVVHRGPVAAAALVAKAKLRRAPVSAAGFYSTSSGGASSGARAAKGRPGVPPAQAAGSSGGKAPAHGAGEQGGAQAQAAEERSGGASAEAPVLAQPAPDAEPVLARTPEAGQAAPGPPLPALPPASALPPAPAAAPSVSAALRRLQVRTDSLSDIAIQTSFQQRPPQLKRLHVS